MKRCIELTKALQSKIDPWLTLEDAASCCGVAAETIRTACASRELESYKTSEGQTGKVLVPYSSLDAWRKRKFVHRPEI